MPPQEFVPGIKTLLGYRPQTLILPYDAHGRIALLGAYYDDCDYFKWGFIQGGMDEHFLRAQKGLGLRREDFLAATLRELNEEVREEYLERPFIPQDISLTPYQVIKKGMHRPRDGFTQGKQFFIAGAYVHEPDQLVPDNKSLRGFGHKIDWVQPVQLEKRLLRRDQTPARLDVKARSALHAYSVLERAA